MSRLALRGFGVLHLAAGVAVRQDASDASAASSCASSSNGVCAAEPGPGSDGVVFRSAIFAEGAEGGNTFLNVDEKTGDAGTAIIRHGKPLLAKLTLPTL